MRVRDRQSNISPKRSNTGGRNRRRAISTRHVSASRRVDHCSGPLSTECPLYPRKRTSSLFTRISPGGSGDDLAANLFSRLCSASASPEAGKRAPRFQLGNWYRFVDKATAQGALCRHVSETINEERDHSPGHSDPFIDSKRCSHCSTDADTADSDGIRRDPVVA